MSGESFEELLRGDKLHDLLSTDYDDNPRTDEVNVNGLPPALLTQQPVTVPLDSVKRPADINSISNVKSVKLEKRSSTADDKKMSAKRRGRKIDLQQPMSKRKAQNRAAQRAFRERKEQHLKDLEDRVSQLEHEAAATNDENGFLKNQVEMLQQELSKYRSGSTVPSTGFPTPPSRNGSDTSTESLKPFSFEFPFYKGGKTADSAVSKVSPASEIALSNTIKSSASAGGLTPASTRSAFSTRSSGSSLTGNEDTDEFCGELSLACGNTNNPVPKVLSGQRKKSIQSPVIEAGILSWPLVPDANNKKAAGRVNTSIRKTSETPSSNASTPASFTTDFLSEYKNSLFDGDFFTLPAMDNEYGMFDPMENPVINSSFDLLADANSKSGLNIDPIRTQQDLKQEPAPKEDDEIPNTAAKLMSCTEAWDRISSHPKFNEIDIDGLCFELRSKAKCSYTGVLLSENDVDIAMQQTLATYH